MILWELSKVFVMALVAITGILLMAGLIAEATQQGLGPTQILAAIPLLIPSTLPYTIPATTLFATCVVYGRLSADNEILAIKASGVNLVHVVKPGVILGIVMSASTMGLSYEIIPSTHHRLRAMIFSDAEEVLYSMLRRQGMINYSQLPYAMFVKSVQGKKLINPVFKRRAPKGEVDFVAHAREAELRVDLTKNLLMIHMRYGVVTSVPKEGEKSATTTDFTEQKFDVELPSSFMKNDVRARDMTWQELTEERDRLTEKLEATVKECKIEAINLTMKGNTGTLAQHVRQLHEKKKHLRDLIRQIDVEKLMRPALSLGCLCFILVGAPVGIWFSRGDYLSAFITCFLPIVIVYYPLMLCGANLAKQGRFNEPILVFGADVVVGLCGIVLFRRLLRN
jgi:lipopolysaccharide export system permease protein